MSGKITASGDDRDFILGDVARSDAAADEAGTGLRGEGQIVRRIDLYAVHEMRWVFWRLRRLRRPAEKAFCCFD